MRKIAFLSHIDMNLYLFRFPIMRRLVNEGWEVYAIVPTGEYSPEFEKHGIRHVSYTLDRKSTNPLKEIAVIYRITRVLEDIKPHILHTFTVKPNIYGSIAGKIAGVPIIVNTITGLGSLFLENDLKSRIIRALVLASYKRTMRFCDAVVFQNKDDLDFFIEKKILDTSKAYLIKGSGINTLEWNARERPKKHSVRVVTVGRLLKHKGIEEFIRAAKVLKAKYGDSVEFVIVGGFYDGNPYSIDRKELEDAVKNGIITHYDWLPIEDVKRILADSDIFVLLSYREGIPRTGIEALSLGLPVVVSDVVGCREIVENGKNGFLVDHRDISDVVDKIERLIKDADLRKKMGLESRKKAEREFDEKIIVDSYISLYTELLRRKENTC